MVTYIAHFRELQGSSSAKYTFKTAFNLEEPNTDIKFTTHSHLA